MMIDSIRKSMSDRKQDLLVVDVSRVNAVTINRIRLDLAQKRIQVLSVKNAVAAQALRELGLENAHKVLSGPSALVYGSDDVVALSKEITKCAEENKDLAIRGGIVEGTVLSESEVQILSKSPGRAEMISQISGNCLNPGANLASAIASTYGKLASQIEVLSQRQS